MGFFSHHFGYFGSDEDVGWFNCVPEVGFREEGAEKAAKPHLYFTTFVISVVEPKCFASVYFQSDFKLVGDVQKYHLCLVVPGPGESTQADFEAVSIADQ